MSIELVKVTKHFGTHSLQGFGFDADEDTANSAALRAAGAVLNYLGETQKSSLAHINQLLPDEDMVCHQCVESRLERRNQSLALRLTE